MQLLRRGRAPTIKRGPYAGEKLTVDHIIPRAVAPALDKVLANLELMQMIVLPRHSALENGMQDVQADVIRHDDTAPDGWFDANQFDFQLNQSVFRLSQWPCR